MEFFLTGFLYFFFSGKIFRGAIREFLLRQDRHNGEIQENQAERSMKFPALWAVIQV